ncbi:hypothetical protein [Cohnella cellulosilytica]|uniref:Uncharacterized protein n=1 Tax=Cohnella cellulosilytica TaxID=986710 RepID=A0ABW2F7K8_9BACL
MSDTHPNSDDSHSFLVEFNISSSNRGEALKQLLLQLNDANFEHYRIVTNPRPGATPTPAKPRSSPAAVRKTAPKASDPNPLELRIRFFIENNKLIRININKGRGVKLSIPCRVLNYDSDKQLLTVYHVDEKQVYTFGLNEIDDFVE